MMYQSTYYMCVVHACDMSMTRLTLDLLDLLTLVLLDLLTLQSLLFHRLVQGPM